jgi:hypothetical protein
MITIPAGLPQPGQANRCCTHDDDADRPNLSRTAGRSPFLFFYFLVIGVLNTNPFLHVGRIVLSYNGGLDTGVI